MSIHQTVLRKYAGGCAIPSANLHLEQKLSTTNGNALSNLLSVTLVSHLGTRLHPYLCRYEQNF
jgi:S-adenosylmethionine:tRNA-ribosyltransferase-isomerase (queuine synthetase)